MNHKPDCNYYSEVVKTGYICTCGAEGPLVSAQAGSVFGIPSMIPPQSFNCPNCGAPGMVEFGAAKYSCTCRFRTFVTQEKKMQDKMPTPESQAAYDLAYAAGLKGEDSPPLIQTDTPTKEDAYVNLATVMGYGLGLNEHYKRKGIRTEFCND